MTNAAGLPFDDIRALVRMMPGPDSEAVETAQARAASLAEPAGSLGALSTLALWAAGWQGKARPTVQRPLLAIFAANHGVEPDGAEARGRMELLAAGGAAVNQVCATFDLGLKVFDLALDLPTPDFTAAAALEEADCAATMAFGMEAIAGGSDLLGLGAIGAGGLVSAAAIAHALYGGDAADWVPAGDEARRSERCGWVAAAVACHRGHLADPLEVLRRLGGRDIAAMAGAILAGRLQRIPVILDSYPVLAAAAVLHAMDSTALEHCIVGHAAPGAHAALAGKLGLEALLYLDLTSGEGTGAALAAGIVKAAVNCHNDTAAA